MNLHHLAIKTLVYLTIISCITCPSSTAFAQSKNAKKTSIVRFGDVDSSMHISRSKLMAKPELLCTLPHCKVTTFAFAILPEGGEFLGPHTITGSGLDVTAKNMINKLERARKTTIFIDAIHVNINGRDSSLRKAAYVFKCQQ